MSPREKKKYFEKCASHYYEALKVETQVREVSKDKKVTFNRKASVKCILPVILDFEKNEKAEEVKKLKIHVESTLFSPTPS